MEELQAFKFFKRPLSFLLDNISFEKFFIFEKLSVQAVIQNTGIIPGAGK